MIQRLVGVILALVGGLALVCTARTAPARAAAPGSAGGLAVFVGYAEDKETNTPNPAAFPVPWQGAPGTVFLGGPVVGQTACGTLPTCYDAGAIRLDNPTGSAIAVSNVTVDIHSALAGGKRFSLWGAFSVPAGESVILTENPPGNNPSYDNFDTSGYPANNCTPITLAPTVTLTIAGVATTLADTTHVLDTGGIDAGYCPPRQNESIQWRAIGSAGSKTATLALSPTAQTPTGGQGAPIMATLTDGGGAPLPNVRVAFAVTLGPNAGQSAVATTDASGHAIFMDPGATGGTDLVTASVTTVGTFTGNAVSVAWPGAPPATWTGADIGGPTLAGSDSQSNGTWTLSGSGTDFGGTGDQGHIVWQTLLGGGGISARVLTVGNTNSRAQAGVMLRASTAADAPFYALVVTPQRGIMVLARGQPGSQVKTITSLSGAVPVYLRVARSGTTFTAFTSADGSTWVPIAGAAVTLPLAGPLLAGMAVSSHTATKLCTATFTAVSVG